MADLDRHEQIAEIKEANSSSDFVSEEEQEKKEEQPAEVIVEEPIEIDQDVTDIWGWKPVWNQYIQENGLLTHMILLIIAILYISQEGLRDAINPLFLKNSNWLYFTLGAFLVSIIVPHFFPSIIADNPLKGVFFLLFSSSWLILLISFAIFMEEYAQPGIFFFFLILQLFYLYYILKTEYLIAGRNPLKVKDYFSSICLFTLINCVTLIFISKIHFLFALVFYPVGIVVQCYLMLELQLHQKREHLFIEGNQIFLGPIYVVSDLVCPCFFLKRHLQKRRSKMEGEEEQPLVVGEQGEGEEGKEEEEE